MDSPKDFTVAAQGKDERDALDQLPCGLGCTSAHLTSHLRAA